MTGKLALSLALSALILTVGGFYAVLMRLDDLEGREATTRGRPPGVVPPESEPAATDEGGEEVTPAHLDARLRQMEENDYDYYTDLSRDLYEIKRELRQLEARLKRIVEGLARGDGSFEGIGWGLAPRAAPIDAATAKAYRDEAVENGVTVEEGLVTVRGFLNMAPNTRMPIEYFMTRFPEAGHETLVHLVGDKAVSELEENPYGALKGLATALYKGMVAAGFREGEPTHPAPGSDPRDPEWIMASGDTVYIAVRWTQDGEEHVALATDWILDPGPEGEKNEVLPVDALRFTGSARGEDPNTGDEILGAEAMGLIVSVWPNAAALVEVALPSALANRYTYNFERIPKPEGDEPLFFEVIFSREPVEPQGLGARPIDRPPPLADASEDGG